MLLFTAKAGREEDERATIMVTEKEKKEKKEKKKKVFWMAQRTLWTV